MLVLVFSIVGAIAIALAGWWVKRRWDRVDSYLEQEYQDPPITDAGSWLGGDR